MAGEDHCAGLHSHYIGRTGRYIALSSSNRSGSECPYNSEDTIPNIYTTGIEATHSSVYLTYLVTCTSHGNLILRPQRSIWTNTLAFSRLSTSCESEFGTEPGLRGKGFPTMLGMLPLFLDDSLSEMASPGQD